MRRLSRAGEYTRLYATRLRFHPWVVRGIPRLTAHLRLYGRLIRLDKPIGTYLLLWPTLWALWVAGAGRPDPQVFAVFVCGVFLMRSAGCAVNDFADREIDPLVERTRDRPLAAGLLQPQEALAVAAGLALIAFGLLLTLNRLTVMLGLVGAILAFSYPFMKRITSLPQAYLGAAFGWSVPMAFAAQTGKVPLLGWLMFLAVVLWAVAYDTMYAMVDREDDLRIGVKSTAILFGDSDRLIVGIVQGMVLVTLYLVGARAELGGWYQLGLLGAAAYFGYQQLLIRTREPARCFRAFSSNHGLGAVVFAGIVLHYTFTSP